MLRLSLLAATLAAVTMLGVESGTGQEVGKDAGVARDLDLPEGIEPLVRGAVHEAFASPTEGPLDPSPPVPKEPPPTVPEIPPDMSPEGAEWIGGYWAWDAEAGDFRWVSGVYRVPPEGRRWIPGHWVHGAEGWRWVSGFWAPAGGSDLPYAPEPPESLDTGPTVPPPDGSSFYVPGVWMYRDVRFSWRPGYYTAFRPHRIWVPAHWVWTPSGFVFVSGYWDGEYEDRGVCFASVYFHRPFWQDPLWCYRPCYVVRPGFFVDALFCGNNHHYYYGNYYARAGFRPWWDGPGRFNPAFAHYRWRNGDNVNWARDLQTVYAERGAGRRGTLPTTFEQQRLALGRGDKFGNVVTPLSKGDLGVRLTKTSFAQIEAQKLKGERSREIGAVRADFEKPGKSALVAGKGEPRTFKLPEASTRFDSAKTTGKLGRSDPIVTTRSAVVGDPRTFDPPRGITPRIGDSPKTITLPGKTTTLPGKDSLPRVVTDPGKGRTFDPPKGTTARIGDAPKMITLPQPKDLPKITGASGKPRFDPPKAAGTPRIIGDPPATVRSAKIEGPKFDLPKARTIDTSRSVDGPRFTPKATTALPKATMSLPKATMSLPKVAAPAPRISSPAPTPRISSPAPTPRISSPPATSRSFTPRSTGSGGGGFKGGGGGSKGGGGGGSKGGRGR